MKITDEKLYELCKKYGEAARLWRQRFIGLLPEVNRRRLYEKKGFSSIFVFAFKLCGLSEEQVRLTLNLGKRFEDKPILKKMLENGEASINKLARVVSIATSENEEELAEKIKILPQKALETFVRDEKYLQNLSAAQQMEETDSKNGNSLQKPPFGCKSLRAQTCLPDRQTLNFEISDDVKEELNELSSRGIDVNELLREALKKRKEEIERKKSEIAEKQTKKQNEKISEIQEYSLNNSFLNNIKSSRYESVEVRNILKQEYGTKCSYPGCNKPSKVHHHTQKFALTKTHDPHFIAPLCEEHHAIAHSIDIKYWQIRK